MLRYKLILFILLSFFVWACGQTSPSSNLIQNEHALKTQEIIPSSVIASDSLTVVTKEYLLGKFDPATHPLFVKIDKQSTDKPNIYMRSDAFKAFQEMQKEASKAGISIKIISATRNFEYQKGIWEKKWLRSKYKGWKEVDKVRDILKYSSMPGTSRHHWGTDVDFNSVDLAYFAGSEGKKLYEWLVKNAVKFGFSQTYTNKSDGRTGYEEEKWHWSYIPVSGKLLAAYNAQITYSDIVGFSGSNSAQESQCIELYVNGIANSLKD